MCQFSFILSLGMIKRDVQGCEVEPKIAEGGLGSCGQAQKLRKLPGALLPGKKKITKNIQSRPQRPSKLPDKLYEGAAASPQRTSA